MSTEWVVVTGGAGFIGSHTVGQLLEAGRSVIVLDNFRTGKRANLDDFQEQMGSRLLVKEVDIVEGLWSALGELLKGGDSVGQIIHLAAQTSVVASINDPIEDINDNYKATVQLLEYARVHGVKKVVMASSAAVYGEVDVEEVAESLRTEPLSPYGIHKLGSEKQLFYYQKVHGVQVDALRFFNVYGPRQDPSSAYSGVISIFVDRAMRDAPITIFGDGSQTRDFVFVKDVARALVTCALQPKGAGEPLNIGTGSAVTVLELAQMIISLCGSKSQLSHKEPRAGEIKHSCASVARAKEQIAFAASVTLKEGLAQTIQWVRATSA